MTACSFGHLAWNSAGVYDVYLNSNMNSFPSAKPFLNYIKSNPLKYKTMRIDESKGGSELSEFIG